MRCAQVGRLLGLLFIVSIEVVRLQNPLVMLRGAPGTVALCALIALFAVTSVFSNRYLHARADRAQRYFERGQRLDRRGETADAIEEYRNALGISRDNREYKIAMAMALMSAGRIKEASFYFQELLRGSPSDALPNLMLARIAWKQGDRDAAIDHYNRAIYGRWPTGSEGSRAETRWELVNVLTKADRRPALIAQLLQIYSDEPDNADERTKVAERLLALGSADQGSRLFRELLQQDIRSERVYAGYGESQIALGNFETARDALTRALLANPSNDGVRRDLELVNNVLSLDPLARGISRTERYRRSTVLLTRVLTPLQACAASGAQNQSGQQAQQGQASPPESQQGKAVPTTQGQQAPALPALVQTAQQALASRPPDLLEAADQRLSAAEKLWDARDSMCTKFPEDEVLAQVMKLVGRQ